MSSSRKSRLKELRELSEKEEVLGGSATALKEEDLFINPSPAANDEETNVTIKLRNYVPKDISALKSTSVGVQILPNAVAPEFKRKKEEENGNTPDDTILHSNGTKKQKIGTSSETLRGKRKSWNGGRYARSQSWREKRKRKERVKKKVRF